MSYRPSFPILGYWTKTKRENLVSILSTISEAVTGYLERGWAGRPKFCKRYWLDTVKNERIKRRAISPHSENAPNTVIRVWRYQTWICQYHSSLDNQMNRILENRYNCSANVSFGFVNRWACSADNPGAKAFIHVGTRLPWGGEWRLYPGTYRYVVSWVEQRLLVTATSKMVLYWRDI
jgi:hypothetical protein